MSFQSSIKGLIFLESENAILREQLRPRLFGNGEYAPLELFFSDFDDAMYKLFCSAECPNIFKINISLGCFQELWSMGANEVVEKKYPGCAAQPDLGYDFALEFDCVSYQQNEAFLNEVADLKRNLMSGPFERAFRGLLTKDSSLVPAPLIIHNRKNERIFICPSGNNSKVVVIFQMDFVDNTDKALARVFLQEFVESQRMIRTAPPASFSSPKDIPMEIAGLAEVQASSSSSDFLGFLSFGLEERHIQGQKLESTISLLVGLRNYLHYHIKASKTYLHMRMRRKVAAWMQVLNRAIPEVETEKKTMAGKSFARK